MERKQDARKGEQPQQQPARPEDEGRPGSVKDEAQAEGAEGKPLDLRVRTLHTENDESGGH